MSKNDSVEVSGILGKAFGATRFLMAIAVFSIFVGATILLIVGSVDMFRGIWEMLVENQSIHTAELRIVLIEAVDAILISTVLYIIAVGLYELFIDSSLAVPEWLKTIDVKDLEIRLAGMIVTILAVIFLTRAIEYGSVKTLMMLGFAVSSVIVAISLFLYQEKK